jgi:N-acetylmuramoyl-L-alanine amidase
LTFLGLSFFSTNEQPAATTQVPTKTIMLNPAGDSNTPGREIDDTLERSLTMHCCQALKELLEEATPSLKVLLTRLPGEAVEPLQNVSFSNRMGVDLYVSIHFYEHKQLKPELFIYTYIQNPATDFIEKKSTDLTFLPYDQAYKLSLKKTKESSSLFYSTCSAAKSVLICHQPLAIPFKPVRGITAPALGIEVGLSQKSDVQKIVPLIAQALKTLVTP